MLSSEQTVCQGYSRKLNLESYLVLRRRQGTQKRGCQLWLFLFASQAVLVELELPWLMKEAALLRCASPGAAPISRICLTAGVRDYAVSQETGLRGLRNLD